MTTPAEPRHTGLRPLGPYGEGYCRVCHFIVPLGYDGQLAPHFKGHSSDFALTGACEGAGTRPPKLTPNRSRLAAFTCTPPYAVCTFCGERVVVTAVKVYGRHFSGPGGADGVCTGSGRPVVAARPPGQKDHSNDRG